MLVQRVKEFVYTSRESVTDYSTQAFTHWVQTMQWKMKDCEDTAHKGNTKSLMGPLKSLGGPGKYPMFACTCLLDSKDLMLAMHSLTTTTTTTHWFVIFKLLDPALKQDMEYLIWLWCFPSQMLHKSQVTTPYLLLGMSSLQCWKCGMLCLWLHGVFDYCLDWSSLFLGKVTILPLLLALRQATMTSKVDHNYKWKTRT